MILMKDGLIIKSDASHIKLNLKLKPLSRINHVSKVAYMNHYTILYETVHKLQL